MLVEGANEILASLRRLAQELEDIAPSAEEPIPDVPIEFEGEPGVPSPEFPGRRIEPEPKPEDEKAPLSFELPPIAEKMSEPDIANLINLIKIFISGVEKADTLTISYASNMIKKLLEKYQKKEMAPPFFSIYSFLQKLESLKKFQDKNLLIDISANKLSSTLKSMGVYPVSSRIVKIETYDFLKRPESGRVEWSIDFVHKSRPKFRATMKIGVNIKNKQATVDDKFIDVKGVARSFDSVIIEEYVKRGGYL